MKRSTMNHPDFKFTFRLFQFLSPKIQVLSVASWHEQKSADYDFESTKEILSVNLAFFIVQIT